MEPYTSLALVFVAVGLALLAAIAHLARLVRRHRRSLGKLLKLAKSNLGPLQLPAAAWPTLTKGGIMRLYFSGNWFGQPVQEDFGAAQTGCKPFSFKITAHDDVRLEFELYARTNRGEARLFAENLAEVFRLLLETAVHGKMQALSAALAEQARLSLYLQHDLRNLAQWVGWIAADFALAKNDEDLLVTAHHLRTSAPHAATRARRILDATCNPRTPPLPETIALADAIREAAEHAGVSVTIDLGTNKQDTFVFLRRDLLDRTLDNLFTNVAPLLRSHTDFCIAVNITPVADKIGVQIKMPRLADTAHPEKLFEPFASGRPGGLGLGLYQAHKSLKEAGGELVAQVCEQHICFTLSLPGAATGPAQV
jgi:hypothetical protein